MLSPLRALGVAFLALAFGACSSDGAKDADAECPVGAETCECTPGGGCNDDLECLSGRCVEPGSISGNGGAANADAGAGSGGATGAGGAESGGNPNAGGASAGAPGAGGAPEAGGANNAGGAGSPGAGGATSAGGTAAAGGAPGAGGTAAAGGAPGAGGDAGDAGVCIAEGQTVAVGRLPPPCCAGTVSVGSIGPPDGGVCPTRGPLGVKTCSNCGNNVCEPWEHACNCANDCG